MVLTPIPLPQKAADSPQKAAMPLKVTIPQRIDEPPKASSVTLPKKDAMPEKSARSLTLPRKVDIHESKAMSLTLPQKGEMVWERKTALPQRELPVPPRDTTVHRTAERTVATVSTFATMSVIEETEYYELMDVSLTVYALSGVCCQADPKTKSVSQGKRALTGKKSASKQAKNQKGKQRKDVNKQKVSDVPTTAIVSCPRNIYSSGTRIETYLPSMCLKKPTLSAGQCVRQTANWRLHESQTYLDGEDEDRCTTFKVSRVLQRQSYRSEETMAHIENYVPETIDVNIGLGRGSEIISIATASVAVTGDEEGETVITVPVKALPKKKKRRQKMFKRQGASATRPKKARFRADPDFVYSLEENAILKVGITVTPRLNNAQPIEYGPRPDGRNIEDILDELFDGNEENLILEFEDENSLLELEEGTIFVKQQPLQQGECEVQLKEIKSQMNVKGTQFMGSSNANLAAKYLCGAVQDMFPQRGELPVKTPQAKKEATVKEDPNRPPVKKRSKEALILPMDILSSVSASTFGGTPH